MKCRHIQDLLGPYLYGELAPDEMRMVRMHMQKCAECRMDFEARGRAVSAVSDAVPQLTDEEKQQIAWSVAGAVKNRLPEKKHSRFRLAPAFALTAMLLVGVGVGGYIGVRMTKSHPPPGTDGSGAIVRVTETPRSKSNTQSGPRKHNSHKKTDKKDDDGSNILIDTATGAIRTFAVQGGQPAASRSKTDRSQVKQDTQNTPRPSPQQNTAQGSDQKPAPQNNKPDNGGEKLPPVTSPNDAQGAD